MKVLKYKYNPDKKGVFKISVVKNPAVGEGDLVLMASQEVKGVFYAPVMIPDLKIQRIGEDGEPYMVYYDADTIEQLMWNYWKQCGNRATNLDHEDDEDGVYPVESWIVKDPQEDKSKAVGMPIQKIGTWIMGYKADSPEVLQKIKDKLLQGLSIEGFLDAEEEMSINFNKQSMFEKLKKGLEDLLVKMQSEEDPAKEKTAEEISAEEKAKMTEEEDPTEPTDVEKELAAANAKIAELEVKISGLETEKAKNENDATLMSAQLTEIAKAFKEHKAVTMSAQRVGDTTRNAAANKPVEQMSNFERYKARKN